MSNRFYITVSKDAIIPDDSFYDDAVFVFNTKDAEKLFNSLNPQRNTIQLKNITDKDTDFLCSNKLAFMEFVYPQLKKRGFSNISIFQHESPSKALKLRENSYILDEVISSVHYLKKDIRIFDFTSLKYISQDTVNEKTVLMIPPGGMDIPFDFSIMRLSKDLRKLGYRVVTLAFGEPSDSSDDIRVKTYPELFSKIAEIAPSLILHRSWMNHYLFAAYLVKIFPNTAVNIKDWNFCGKRKYGTLFGKKSLSDFDAVSFIFKNAKLVLSHYTEKQHQIWAKRYGCPADKFLFFPEYCSVENFCDNSTTDKNSIVWAGSVPPTSMPKENFPGRSIFDSFCLLAGQGIDCYVVPPEKYYDSMIQNNALYADFINADKSLKGFSLVRGKDADPSAVSGYGFGVFILRYDSGPKYYLNKYAVPSKFAFYLEAGLPIIANERLSALSKLITDNGIGLVVSNNELKNLHTRLKNLTESDYLKMRENVRKFRENFIFDENTIKSITSAFQPKNGK